MGKYCFGFIVRAVVGIFFLSVSFVGKGAVVVMV